MTTYGQGLDYDAILDALQHLDSNAVEGTYDNPGKIIIDNMGHVVHIEGGSVGSAFIEGLGYSWQDANNVTLEPGSAYIPAVGRAVDVASPISVPIPGAVSQNYYMYLQESGDVGSVYVSTTAPDTPYYSTARTLPGDTSRRYLGMVKNDSAGRVIQFETEELGNRVLVIYGEAQDGQSIMGWDSITATTTLQSRSIGPTAPTTAERMVPPTCRTVNVALEKGGTVEVRVGWPLDQAFGIAPVVMQAADGRLRPGTMRLSPTQSLYYKATSGTANVYLMVLSYYERR